MLWPKDITINAYRFIFSTKLVWFAYRNTIIITVFGTLWSLFMTILFAYPISRPHFMAKPFLTYMVIITMLFNGGLVPNFYLIRTLGMYDSLLALIIPGAIGAFNVILFVNFFKNIPDELIESAKIEGASDMQVLWYIVLPLSLAIIATLALFGAVGRWNSYFSAIIYIRSREKWTLQLLLREMILSAQSVLREPGSDTAIYPQTIQYAAIVVATVPILCVYPFVQKHFVKGIMIGAVKG